MNLAQEIRDTRVGSGEVALFWLGQAGFLVKTAAGKTIAVDPYLTDCGFRMKEGDPAFKRLSPMLLAPEELDVDLYLISHHHFDHFDYDAVPVAAKKAKTVFAGPSSIQPLLDEAGVAAGQKRLLNRGTTLEEAGVRVTATTADHGDMAPDCIGIFIDAGGVRLWFCGDTCYHPEMMAEIAAMRPDVAVVSINGEFGNLTAEEGAKVARDVKARWAIPCHFWTFTQHKGAPWDFVPGVKALAPACTPVMMRQGECIVLRQP